MFGVQVALVVVLVAYPSLCNPAGDINWDRPIDVWLDMAKRHLLHTNQTEITVDDVKEDFMVDLGFTQTPGRLVAWEGSLGDISTLKRRGRVSFARAGAVTKLTTRLGWDALTLTFKHFRVDMLDMHIQGDLQGKIKANCVEITLAFTNVDGGCVTTCDDLKLIEFGDFDLKVNGLGPFNFLASAAVLMVSERHKHTMAANTEEKLKDLVTRSLLADYHCEEDAALLGLPLN